MNKVHQLAIGTMLEGRYLVGEVIGEGGFGITYAGEDTRLGMKIAIKEYYPVGIVNRNVSQSSDLMVTEGEEAVIFEKGKADFLTEAKALAQFVSESAVVYVRDYFEANETAYIVMEYIDGMSLNQYLKQVGRVSFEQALNMLEPVMEALGRIHQKGVIHRDISPANLMRLNDGSVKILDFGAARQYDVQREKGLSVMLKPGYAPEEQYRSNAPQGPWTDVYAMSATIYKMITGMVPEDAMNRIFQDDLKRPSSFGVVISPEQEEALLKGLAVVADDRYQNMLQLLTGLKGEKQTATIDMPKQDALLDEERTYLGVDLDETTMAERTLAGAADERTMASSVMPAQQIVAEDRMPAQQIVAEDRMPAQQTVAGDAMPAPQKVAVSRNVKSGIKPTSQVKEVVTSEGEKPRRRRGKTSLAVTLAGIGVAIVVAVMVIMSFYQNDPYLEGHSVYLYDQVVTSKMTSVIARDKKVDYITLYNCEIDDGALKKLAKSKSAQSVDLDSCKGFTTLDMLADMKSLQNLYINYYDESDRNGGKYITTDFPSVTNLEMRHNDLQGQTEFLQHFPNATSLVLSDTKGLADGKDLVNMASLSNLSAGDSDLSQDSLANIARCENLESVSLYRCHITDLTPLADLGLISFLDVSENELTDLNGLENCKKLASLMADQNQISDISALSELNGLYTIDLDQNQISDLSPLAGLTRLDQLELEDNQISDLTPLAGLDSIATLYLAKNQISDISPLKGMADMMRLDLDENQLTQLDALSSMTKLVEFHASRNQISDISGIANSTQMEELHLNQNQITDISPLSHYDGQIYSLHLAENQISDITPLKGSSKLKLVELYSNQLTSIQTLGDSDCLYYVSVHDNQLTNLSGLENSTAIYFVDAANNQLTDISALSQNKPGNAAYAFEHNQISDLSPLSDKSVEYEFLSLYDNPIEDLSPIMVEYGETGRSWSSWGLYLSCKDASEQTVKNLVHTGFEYKSNVVGVDIGEQGSFRTSFGKECEAYGGSGYAEPIFYTMEEADQKVLEYRYEIEGKELKDDKEEGEEE